MTNTLNFNNIKLIDGDFKKSNEWAELSVENDGSFSQTNQYMVFECDKNEVIVNFNYHVDSNVEVDNGDYYNPPSVDVEIDDVDINIENIFINDVETNVDSETFSFFMKQLKKELN